MFNDVLPLLEGTYHRDALSIRIVLQWPPERLWWCGQCRGMWSTECASWVRWTKGKPSRRERYVLNIISTVWSDRLSWISCYSNMHSTVHSNPLPSSFLGTSTWQWFLLCLSSSTRWEYHRIDFWEELNVVSGEYVERNLQSRLGQPSLPVNPSGRQRIFLNNRRSSRKGSRLHRNRYANRRMNDAV